MTTEEGTEPGTRAGAGGGNNVHALARLLRISERRVQQLVRDGTLPRPDSRGQYNAAACVHAYIGFLQYAVRRTNAELQAERARLVKAQADRAEIQVGELSARLIPAENLERVLEFFATSVRSRLLSMPRKLAVRISPENPRDVEARLEAEVHSILEELANDDTLPEWLAEGRSARAQDRAARLAASAESDGERVGRPEHPAP